VSLLLVEDELSLAVGLVDVLRVKGYEVDHVVSGEEALERAGQRDYRLVLLDASLPGMSGFEVLRHLRQRRSEVMVLMLTARGSEADRVLGFELGADDYVTKPFSLAELLGRIGAMLRRGPAPSEAVRGTLQFGSLVADLEAYTLSNGEALPRRAFDILRLLSKRQGQVVSRDQLMDEVWGVEEAITHKTIHNLVARIRQQIESDPEQPRFLKTVHGVGYRLDL
jgi:two-component system response regulator RegX3